jgi:hypothetical protein
MVLRNTTGPWPPPEADFIKSTPATKISYRSLNVDYIQTHNLLAMALVMLRFQAEGQFQLGNFSCMFLITQ